MVPELAGMVGMLICIDLLISSIPRAPWSNGYVEQVGGYQEMRGTALNPPNVFADSKRVCVCQSVSNLCARSNILIPESVYVTYTTMEA